MNETSHDGFGLPTQMILPHLSLHVGEEHCENCDEMVYPVVWVYQQLTLDGNSESGFIERCPRCNQVIWYYNVDFVECE